MTLPFGQPVERSGVVISSCHAPFDRCRFGLRGSVCAPRRAFQRLVTRHTGMVHVGRDLLDLLSSLFYFDCYFIIHRRYFII
jgi:hypothetical protein